MINRVLIVEDEAAIRLAVSRLLKKEGYEVDEAGNGTEAIAQIESYYYDLIITDNALGKGPSGMEVLEMSRAHRSETPVVMITAHGNEKVAVEAMKKGAIDYVPKPFDNDEIRLVVRRALDHTRLQREHRLLLERIEREYGFGALIGSGPEMKKIFETIKKVAETDLTVLVRGESGTGKELVAQALHHRSPRRNRPFIAVNCAAISRELVESELFGHEKGAFTGADARRVGRFEAASGGTIFLDEIGDMPLETQAKVLRVLQERKLERVGGVQPIDLDVRVVAATHRDLELEVKNNQFREDLYYRLKVVQTKLPPLRARSEDIPALTDRFLNLIADRLGREKMKVSPATLQVLMSHHWPGNVRELRNVVEQAAVMASGDTIQPDDLMLGASQGVAPAGAAPMPGVTFAEAKKEAVLAFERSYIAKALENHGGNISRTAEAIGMVRQSLQQKIRELGLNPEDYRS